MKLFRGDPHALSGAYAINAIDDTGERDRFERHLHRCQQCSSEVKGLTETTTRLAYNVSRPPPVLMRDQVLTAVSHTRQLPPIVDKRAQDRAMRSSPWWRLWTGAPYVLALASVVALIVILVGQASTDRQLDHAKARIAALTAVLSAPDSRAKTQTAADGTRATVVYSLHRHALVAASGESGKRRRSFLRTISSTGFGSGLKKYSRPTLNTIAMRSNVARVGCIRSRSSFESSAGDRPVCFPNSTSPMLLRRRRRRILLPIL